MIGPSDQGGERGREEGIGSAYNSVIFSVLVDCSSPFGLQHDITNEEVDIYFFLAYGGFAQTGFVVQGFPLFAMVIVKSRADNFSDLGSQSSNLPWPKKMQVHVAR